MKKTNSIPVTVDNLQNTASTVFIVTMFYEKRSSESTVEVTLFSVYTWQVEKTNIRPKPTRQR